ncbi:hypothetical protein CRUP_034630 [Coryphaenoides rupestris]|nr:hypothetical protein CRUP_034630 [Coryphaenoides rupestris]
MKRTHNDSSSDSDMDDNIEVEKDSGDDNGTPDSPSTSTQLQARKRRRGIIEKRRRDRINNSLSELRRLVPSAFEKQGSSKLEKAEILQMTVDHLKMLHAAGGKGYFEAHAFSKDYRSLGFRECLAETARYLSVIEGRDSSDPLRARLVSHLSNYGSQREMHNGLGHLAWSSSAFGSGPAHLSHPMLLQHPHARMPTSRTGGSNTPSSSSSSASTSSSPSSSSSSSSSKVSVANRHGALPSAESHRLLALGLTGPVSKISTPLLSSLSAFPISFGAFPLIPPTVLSPLHASPASIAASATSSSMSKPYRPWGLEIGAF